MAVPGLVFVALPIGPSLGHFYADNPVQAIAGIAVRTGALAVGIVAAVSLGSDGDVLAPETRLVGSVAVLLGSVAYDIATAGPAARAYNRRHGLDARRAAAVVVAPAVGADGQRGIRLAARF